MAGSRYKTKTTVQKDGSIFQEQVPLDPVVDDREFGKEKEGEVEEQEEAELTPDEEQYLNVARKLAGTMLKFKVFRIVDGGERFCGSLSAKEFEQDDPIKSLQARFGGGSFKVYFYDPDSQQDFSVGYEIEGEPKASREENSVASGGVTFQLPKAPNSDPTVAAMMNFMSSQLMESQRMVNSLVLKMADSKSSNQQQANIAGLSLDQLAVIKELFADRRKDETGEKLKEWLGLVKSVVETVPQILGGQNEASGWLNVAQQIAPKVSEVLGQFVANKTGVPPPQQQRPAIGPAGAQPQQPGGQPAGADVIRQVFETMYLKPLIEAATEDVDPYTLTFNFKAQMGGNTQDFLPALGLQSVPQFYERYPETKKYEEWFNEFFFYMFNPTAKPDLDEDEEEEVHDTKSNGEAADVEVVISPEQAKEMRQAQSRAALEKARAAKAAKQQAKKDQEVSG